MDKLKEPIHRGLVPRSFATTHCFECLALHESSSGFLPSEGHSYKTTLEEKYRNNQKKKNTFNLQSRRRKANQNFYKSEEKKLKTGKQDPIGKIAQQIKAPALKTDHQSLIPL